MKTKKNTTDTEAIKAANRRPFVREYTPIDTVKFTKAYTL